MLPAKDTGGRRRAIFFALVLVDLLVCVLFFEGILQVTHYFHKGTGVSTLEIVDGLSMFEKNVDRLMRAEDRTESSLIRYITNSEGYHDKEYPRARESGVLRFAAIGDSYTAATGVDSDSNFLALLEEGFEKRPVEVINFGVLAQGTADEAVRYVRNISLFNPTHVVLFVAPNDFKDNQYALSAKDEIQNHEWLSVPLSYADVSQTGVVFWLRSKFRTVYELDEVVRSNLTLRRLAVYLGVRQEEVVSVRQDTIPPEFFIYQAPLSEDWQEIFSLTEVTLVSFKKEVEERGGTFALVYIPEVVQVDPERIAVLTKEDPAYARYEWRFDQPNNFFKEVARKNGIPFLDLTPSLRAQYMKDKGVSLFANGVGHQNQLGHAYMAEALVPFFETLIADY